MKNCIWLCLIFTLIILSGCAKPEKTSLYTPIEASQKLYLKSQQELNRGEYRQAYIDYKGALAEDSGIANSSHLSSIMYGWVISKCTEEDIDLLKAQKNVWLKPNQLALRKELISIAVNNEVINVFGLAMVSDEVSNTAQKRLSARRAALLDCQTWIARLSNWIDNGIDEPFDAKFSSENIGINKEFWVEEFIYVIKAELHLNDSE